MQTTGSLPFGTTASGIAVDRVVLGAGDLTVSLLTLGAALQSVRLTGVDHSLTIGSDRLADYEGPLRHHGTLIGPVVNRITRASALFGGLRHDFPPDPGDTLILHSGMAGTHRKVWALSDVSASLATLSLTLPDGEGGFPGRRQVSVRYTLSAPATLRMQVSVTTDTNTLINFANHSYWNLDGTPDFAGHTLRIAADRYLPATAVFTPTGEIAPVAGSPYDFRSTRKLTPGAPSFDTNFCVSDTRRDLTDVAWLTGSSGLRMTMATTEPGLQVYDSRQAVTPDHPAYQGLALEAQLWPDAPANPGFPSIELAPGAAYAPITEWRFDRV